ncbi:hypothetical protein BDV33DRAFT_167702 [Aspergillus novoparasiticus]|uniref:Uncharacterized protein n=1 Tax=Aspergillus novoparasiticus TaxID=986946 RepID=A0A5N6F3F2_9EURO|nr:hypothetical protein BDV33DRAFT_167702 [Aspergillus novoparasiticus]
MSVGPRLSTKDIQDWTRDNVPYFHTLVWLLFPAILASQKPGFTRSACQDYELY